jgi:hypothetical protein
MTARVHQLLSRRHILSRDNSATSKMTAVMLLLPQACYSIFRKDYHSITRFVVSNSSIIASTTLAPAKLNRER